MLNLINKATFLLLLTAYTVSTQTCNNLGDLNVFYDPTCAQGGPGCNAGGQNPLCRFCGFDIFPPCPSATQPTTPKPTGPTTPKTTKSTTPKTTKSTTTRDPSLPTVTGPVRPVEPEIEYEYNEFGERLVFSDDFDTFDLKKWKHDLTMSGGGNWEFQLYHNNRTNSFAKDGVLHIVPTLTEDRIGADNLKQNYRMDMWGGGVADACTGNNFYGCERTSGAGGNILNPIQSAKITTQESFSFKYGRVEIVAKLPEGDWLWPAIWMLPRRNQYGMWPASGEIDIMESRGNANYPQSSEGGCESYGSTLHWGADWTQNRFELTHAIYNHPSKLSEDFHTYGLYWTAERLYTYIDDPDNIVLDVDLTSTDFWEFGKFPSVYNNPWETAEEPHAPFNEEFYLIINLAVGGTAGYFPDGVAGKPWQNTSPSSTNQFYAAKNQWWPTWQKDPSLQIDSVKVWDFN